MKHSLSTLCDVCRGLFVAVVSAVVFPLNLLGFAAGVACSAVYAGWSVADRFVTWINGDD